MKTAFKLVLVLLASAWFFPVSCTAVAAYATTIIADSDARYFEQGDTLHAQFVVLGESKSDNTRHRLYELGAYEVSKHSMVDIDKGDEFSFLLSQREGGWQEEYTGYRWQVLEETTDRQLIEVIETYHDGDNTIWSRYWATDSAVQPVSSRMFYYGYGLQAFPIGFAAALFIYFLAKLLIIWVGVREHKAEQALKAAVTESHES